MALSGESIYGRLRSLSAIVSEQEQHGELTALLAHLRESAPRGHRVRLTATSGPYGLVISSEPVGSGRWRVIARYHTAELRRWVDEQIEMMQEAGLC